MSNFLTRAAHLQSVGFLMPRFVATLLVVTVMVMSLLPPMTAHASGDTIGGGSNMNGHTDTYIPVTGVTVSGAGSDTVPVNLSVDSGQLSMTTITGLTFTGDQTGSTLKFEGTVTNVNAALATLRYRTTSATTITFSAQLTDPGIVYYPGNGHLYEVVNVPGGITATNSFTAAAGRSLDGATGYLATITTQAENDYVGPRLGGDGWFGASDAAVEGNWIWAAGPENGTMFWQGLGSDNGGHSVGGLYSNWNGGGEPNNSGGNEDCSEYYSNGNGWNDLPCNASLDYYIVEYGGDGVGLPTVSSTSFTITTTYPDPNDVPIGNCLDLIDVATNQNDHRYDNLKLTSNIDCDGQTIHPMFNEEDPDFGLQTFRGTFDGQGHTISNLTINEGGTASTAFIAHTDGATIQNLTLHDGSITGGDCTGALVGTAYDTTITGVTSNTTVTGNNDTGGLVGCYNTTGDDTAMTGNSVSATVNGGYYIGGLIGGGNVDGGHTFNLDNNTWTGSMTTTQNWAYGGLMGEFSMDNASHVTLKHNTSSGLSMADSYGVGGLAGYMQIEGGSTADIEANTLTDGIEGSGEVGGLVGELDTYDESQVTITNSTQPHDVIGHDWYIGGLVGDLYMEGDAGTEVTISNSSVTGNVSSDDGGEVGGLVGEGYGDSGDERLTITGSHTTGDVTSSSEEVGGLGGYLASTDIENSYATGTISGDSGSVGGLVGDMEDSTITQSYATGTVNDASDSGGGLVGVTYSTDITRSFATGDVTGFGAVGGLVGYYNSGSITDSYARGNADGDNGVGGLVGACAGDILSSYATGTPTSNGADIGGLVGTDNGCTVNDSFWDTQTSHISDSVGATGKTTTEMKAISTFTDTVNSDGLDNAWDFDAVWGITPGVNDGYPCLLWQDENCADNDADGASTPIEDAAPNSGDANDDGTADSEQSNVASFVNDVSDHYTTVALPVACALNSATSQTEGAQTAQDAGYQYQSGLVHFTADCGTQGYTATVTVYLYGVPKAGLVLRKYNPNTHAYFTVPGATLTQETIGGQIVTVATYSVTDGGELDTDGTANGVIVDPVGLATSAVGAPNTGLGGLGRL